MRLLLPHGTLTLLWLAVLMHAAPLQECMVGISGRPGPELCLP